MNLLRRLAECFFGLHIWSIQKCDRYTITRITGSKEGEVTLTLMECRKCGKKLLAANDRSHSLKQSTLVKR